MIKRIFFDLDETLIHTMLREPNQNHVKFALEGNFNTYHTIIRPCAMELIEWAREQVGEDNVYILTAATEDYAREINRLSNFNFSDDHILSREITELHTFSQGYGGYATVAHKDLADSENVLIDNLTPRYNQQKMNLLDINSSRYYQVRDYYGVNNHDKEFVDGVKDFILDKLKN